MNVETRHADASGAPQRPAVDIVIVNWNTAAQAVAAADAYCASNGVQPRVVIVDNGSLPSQQELLRRAADGQEPGTFCLIEAGGNPGFGAAANLGLKDGTGGFILVSNADVSPAPEAVGAMCQAAGAPQAGMVGPVFEAQGNNYHDHLPGPLTLLVRCLIGSFGRKAIPTPPPGQTRPVEQPSGACFLMRRDVWEETEGFDENFFLWYEDVDLARRLNDAGRSGTVVGDARVRHLGGESFTQLEARTKQSIRLESLERYLRLHHPITRQFARPLLWFSRRLRT